MRARRVASTLPTAAGLMLGPAAAKVAPMAGMPLRRRSQRREGRDSVARGREARSEVRGGEAFSCRARQGGRCCVLLLIHETHPIQSNPTQSIYIDL